MSNPAFGPVDAGAGMDASADRTGDVATAFIQGQGADRRLVVAAYDRVPGHFIPMSGSGYRSLKAKPLVWSPSSDIWGTVKYTVLIDGKSAGQTTATKFTPPKRVRDGKHRWKVVATDARGQQSATTTGTLRVDETPPSLHVTVSRSGATVTVSSTAHDKRSGLRSIVTSFGDGKRVEGARATHRYRSSGSFKLKVTATDQAGARRLSTRTIRIKK
jgi:hypothetical protein